MKTRTVLLALALLLTGCSDLREQDLDACTAEAMRSGIQDYGPIAKHNRACMGGKGYVYRMDDLCINSYGNGVVVWACFDKRPRWKFGT